MVMSKYLTVRQVADKSAEAMMAMGQSPISVWRCFYPCCVKIVHYYERSGKEYYDSQITAEYIEEVESRFENGQLSRSSRNFFRKTAERMDEVFFTGGLQWTVRSRHKREPLNPVFTALHSEYLQTNDFHPNTKADVSWVLHKHLLWLMDKDHADFSAVTEKDVGDYISYCVKHLSPGSVRNLISYTRKFYDYLSVKGETSIYYEGFMSVRIRRPEKIQAPATPDEVEAVLSQINRATPQGKRDYAAILLGARMGLRAADIVCLKLRNIDWKNNEIGIVQQKTDDSLLLPMPADVAEALKEYILRVRPETDYEQVFLRAQAPFQPLNAGSSLGYLYDRYLQKEGFERKSYDGKGFHSLRRMLGKELTVAGVPVTTVAQILGHKNLNTAKQYISLDTIHLKECALDFRGIEVVGGRCNAQFVRTENPSCAGFSPIYRQEHCCLCTLSSELR
jgi:integrase